MKRTFGFAAAYLGDAREIMPMCPTVDMLLIDPPYGETALEWDQRVGGWLELSRATLEPHGSMWVFGSMRLFQETAEQFRAAGWRYAQDIVWEKHNGTGLFNDRFRRVHEHAVQFYPDGVAWSAIYKNPQFTNDATARTIRKKAKPAHWIGAVGPTKYRSEDGGPRLMRSVLPVRSCHGDADHPTQKPIGILDPLIRYSCPPGGFVGDWFMGSGSTGVAALESGRGFTGCEIDPAYYEIACRRLETAHNSLHRMMAQSG